MEKKIDQTQYEIQKANWIGTAVDVVLTIIKIIFGIIGNSQALLADGFHSMSDVLTDLMVVFAAHHGHEPPDADHPYGHARIETATSVGIGIVLLLVAGGLIWDAVSRLFEPGTLLIPTQTPIWVALFSLLAKEALYHYTMAVAYQQRSALLRANAWNHRSDGFSTMVVLVGVLGARSGLDYLDAISAVLVGMMIVQVAWEIGWEALRELIDTGIDPNQITAIRQAILTVDGIKALHLLRTRHMGTDILVDVHILLSNPEISVSEGHQISEAARKKLIQEIENITDVTVHIDPEDDEQQQTCTHLPLRAQIMPIIDELWRDLRLDCPRREVTLHYLDGRVHADIVLQLPETGADLTAIESKLRAAASSHPHLGRIRVRVER